MEGVSVASLGSTTNPESIGKVRIAVVGDAGVGKSTLAHFLTSNGAALKHTEPTLGCNVFVKLVEYIQGHGKVHPLTSAMGLGPESQPYFVELWEIGGGDRYGALRSLFYAGLNGVIFVHDLSYRQSYMNLNRWAQELADRATFSAPSHSASYGPGGLPPLPVPVLIVGNKADVADKRDMLARDEGSGWLARAYRSLQRRDRGAPLLPETDPMGRSAGGAAGMRASALMGVVDVEAFDALVYQLVERSRNYSVSGGSVQAKFRGGWAYER